MDILTIDAAKYLQSWIGSSRLHPPARPKANAKVVKQYSLTGKYVQTFCSVKEAGYFSDTSLSRISMCAMGKCKSANGFIYRYVL